MNKIAFLFSGQGAQYSGMMKDLYDSYPECADIFNKADSVLERSISSLCFSGSQDELNLTHNTQPCMLAADLAAYYAIKSHGIKPDVMAGFSLGEFAALTAAGVLSAKDAFRIIQLRADAMQDAVPVGMGGMAAVMGMSAEDVLSLCNSIENGFAAPANYNCPGQIVVSGDKEGIDSLLKLTAEKRIRAVSLPVSAPFHCKLMTPASEKLREAFKEIIFNSPSCPVIMNVDAKSSDAPDEIKNKLVMQANSPVQWIDTLLSMQKMGINIFIELGPGKTLSGFVRKTIKDAVILRVENIETLNETLEKLESLNVL